MAITGCVFTFSTRFQLLQYPLTDLIEVTFKGDPFWPCFGLVSLTLPIVLLVFILQKGGYLPQRKLSDGTALNSSESPRLYGQDLGSRTADCVSAGSTPNLSSPLLVKNSTSSTRMDDLDLNLRGNESTPIGIESPTHLRTSSNYSDLKV